MDHGLALRSLVDGCLLEWRLGGSGSGGSSATAGTGGSAASGATGGNADELPYEDPGADAPVLDLPQDVTDAVNAIAGASSFTEAIAATQAALAKGGVSTMNDATVLTPGEAPAATAQVQAVFLGDMAMEAWKRKEVATLTATQLGQMFADFGMPVPEGKTSGQVVLEALAAWTKAALTNPSDPAAFGILFIAAENQLQSPRANLSLTTQDPDLVRFSLLDLELLSAAIDRVSTSDPKPLAGGTGPCSVMTSTWGQWEGTIKTGTGAGSDLLVGEFLSGVAGDAGAAAIGAALNVVKLATKVWKMAQMVRYGTLFVTIDTENPTKKPRPSAAKKYGSVTATAGVDAQSYEDFQNWIGQQGQSVLDELNTCLDYLGMPTKTDIADVAKDASNWRVSWEITKGAGTEALFKEGQDFKILSRLENPLSSASSTEAKNTVEYEILPQLAELSQGKERTRHAVFAGQLRRGSAPGLDTFWGAGAGAYGVATAGVSGLLGVGASLVDIAGNWALEVASPKRFATQTLIEIEPKGWVGTIEITEEGQGQERLDSGAIPIDGVWYAWTGRLKYEARISLGGTQPATGDLSTLQGVGQSAANCDVFYDESSGNSNCGEGCPTAIEPGPLSQKRDTLTGTWGTSEELGQSSSIVVTSYPEAAYAPIKDQLPPEIQAKIGTYEILISPLACGPHEALWRTIQTDVQLISPNYITNTTNKTEQLSVNQVWGALPPSGAFPMVISGKLDELDPNRIHGDWTMPSTQKISIVEKTIKTTVRARVDIRRVE